MAITPNTTTEGTGSSRLYTGVALLKVVAINPNQAKLKELGYKADKEPSYYDENNGHRIAFYLEGKAGNDVIRTNAAYFLKNVVRTELFINGEGNFGKDRSKLTGAIRNPYQGEVDLLLFIADWCNIKKGEPLSLESIEKIAKTGDLFELREIFNNAKENVFKGLLLVRDGKYQSVYTKKLMRSWNTDLSYLHKSLVDNGAHLKGDFGPIDLKLFVPEQFELRAWKGAVGVVAETAAATASSNGNGSAAPTAEATGEAAPGTDDAPF